jgi:copper(I)-binding protein
VNRALRAATMGVLLLSPVVLSACSAGQVTQTATQQRDKTGAQAQVGDLSIRAAELAAPRSGGYESGDDAELRVAIVNGGTESDTLVGVDGKGFSSAEISSSGGSSSGSSSAGSSSAGSSSAASTTGAAPTSGSTSSSAPTSGSGASTSTSSSGASEDIEIPAGQSVFIGGDQYTITLTGLDANLNTGQYLEVTLTFEKAGSVTIPVTVANPTSSETRGDAFDFHQTEGGSASGSAGG